MIEKKITLEQLVVVGIAVRTNNADGKAMREIGELWQRFYTYNVMQKIPNRTSDKVYCIYTDYKSDFTGDYTTVIGCEVSSIEGISDDLIVKEIPKCDYLCISVEGKVPEIVGETWNYIWKSDIKRKYVADFDVYDNSEGNPDRMKVTTYLSI